MTVGWTKAEYDQCPELASRLHSRILDLEDETEALRDALRQTVDLCNALRGYAPTLNLAAERRLRESLTLIGSGATHA